MIPYLVFVFCILFFRRSKSPFLIYVTLVLFNVLRYNTGWDYMSYVEDVENWGSGGSSMVRYSFFWRSLFEFAHTVNSPHFAIAITGFLTVTIIYYVVMELQKNKELACDSLSIYAFWPYFYLGTFSTIRQALGIAVGLLILLCAVRRKFFSFIILLCLNFLIHPSSIICILFAFFFHPNFKLSKRKIVLILMAAIILLYFIGAIIQSTPLARYQTYLQSNDSYGSKLSILMALILIPTLFLKKRGIGYRGITDVCICALLLSIFVFAGLHMSIIARVADYFIILLIFVAARFKSLFTDKKLGGSLVVIGFLCVFIFYLISTKSAVGQGLAVSPFVPYTFIFAQ